MENLENEVWATIEGNNKYLISNMGRVKSLYRHGLIMKPQPDADGYSMIGLLGEAGYKRYAIHRLVGMAFIKNPLNKPLINHKNGVKFDNRVKNLEWCTPQENVDHAWDNGFFGSWVRGGSKIRKTDRKNLMVSNETVVRIRELYGSGKRVIDIAKSLNIPKNNVSQICRKKNWKWL